MSDKKEPNIEAETNTADESLSEATEQPSPATSTRQEKVTAFFKQAKEKAEYYAERSVYHIDRGVRFMIDSKGDEQRDEAMQTARTPIVIGVWVLLVFAGVFGTWATFAPLDSAAIAPGVVIPDSRRKTVQHLEGGIIDTILVREGDHVKEGDVLLRLSAETVTAHQGILMSQYYSTRAMEARLTAERKDLENLESVDVAQHNNHTNTPHPIAFDADLLAHRSDPKVAEIIDSQIDLYTTQKKNLLGQMAILQQRIEQLNEETEGLKAQKQSTQSQLDLIKEEVSIVKTLLKKGNSNKPRLLALQRQAAQLEGKYGEYRALIAKVKQTLIGTQLEISNLRDKAMNKVLDDLRGIQEKKADLEERLRASEDTLDRLVVRAPHTGIITALNYHTNGGVIGPRAPIMDIIPQNDKLLIEARVAPQDIDVVTAGFVQGLDARVRLTAYRARYVPALEGKVTNVSPDRFVDEVSGTPYYLAQIEIKKDVLEDLPDIDLYPGMPADVLIVTGTRTFMQYLLNPISETMRHAFREE